MSTQFINLFDRIITDEGEVVGKYGLFLRHILAQKPFEGLTAVDDPDIRIYNQRTKKTPIPLWKDDGKVNGPPAETYDWTFPPEFQDLDVAALSRQLLHDRGYDEDVYVDRLNQELAEMEKRAMFPFIRCLIYITDRMRRKKAVWGVGRGSSCASLVLFILDINKVDPVKHDIPMEEFFK